MINQRIIFLTICLSLSSVVWCDNNDGENNFARLFSYPHLTHEVSTADETANDAAIRNILGDIANGKLAKDDSALIELIKNSMTEISTQNYKVKNNNSRATIKASMNKVQSLVTELTAAYTQAIFRVKSRAEARLLLSRFQKTIQMIVDLKKNEISTISNKFKRNH